MTFQNFSGTSITFSGIFQPCRRDFSCQDGYFLSSGKRKWRSVLTKLANRPIDYGPNFNQGFAEMSGRLGTPSCSVIRQPTAGRHDLWQMPASIPLGVCSIQRASQLREAKVYLFSIVSSIRPPSQFIYWPGAFTSTAHSFHAACYAPGQRSSPVGSINRATYWSLH